MAEIFRGGNITITLCHGKIEVPPVEIRSKIIVGYHGSLIGGRKGTTKPTAVSESDTHGLVYGTKSASSFEGAGLASNRTSSELVPANQCLSLTLLESHLRRFHLILSENYTQP